VSDSAVNTVRRTTISIVVAVVSIAAAAAAVGGLRDERGFADGGWILRDLGTLGGKRASATAINARGWVIGESGLGTRSGASHAFVWRGGKMHDLGGAANTATFPTAINDRGHILLRAGPRIRCQPFLWRDGRLIELRGLCEASDLNERGQVVGASRSGLDGRAVLWENGRVRQLGTLRGAVMTSAELINGAGDVIGSWQRGRSNTDFVMRAFVWQKGKMRDLGSLGGKDSWVHANAINDRGHIVGSSDLSGDLNGPTHAFLWQKGRMHDLGTLGGRYSEANAINNRGDVVGTAETRSGDQHAFLWQKGRMTDLGTLGGHRSHAYAINNRGHVVGTSVVSRRANCLEERCQEHGFVWQSGHRTDLGTVRASESAAFAINDGGQIVGERESWRYSWTHPVLWTRSP